MLTLHRKLLLLVAALAFVATIFAPVARAQDDGKDWSMYNRDVRGWRHNPGETALSPATVGRLEEKWRFPAKGSGEEIGVIHATPIVVDGYVYFGTASDPAFYKLTPDGKVRWVYRNPAVLRARADAPTNVRFALSANGILGSALVTADTVYFGDIGGCVYALDRATGAERWKINMRAAEFPDAHPFNCTFASPIFADGKIIMAGGTLEQAIAIIPGFRGANGRGFVMALEPATGKIIWKYNVGPKPERFDPPLSITDAWGTHKFTFGPATASVWCTPSFDPATGTIFFGTDANNAPRRPTADNPNLHTRESCAIIAVDVKDGSERWATQLNPGDVWTIAMRTYDPATGRYKDQSIGDTPKIYTVPVDGAPTKVVGVGCKNGGFYVLRADNGRLVNHTPLYTGPPTYPLSPPPDKRMLALPGPLGGLQTGCATDGTTVYTNGIDALGLGTSERQANALVAPTAGRVVAVSLDTTAERWRHERPKVPSLGGPPPRPVFTDVGDPVASGVAVASGVIYFTTVASGQLVALDSKTGAVLKEIPLGPVWSGPSVSRGRVYVGTGNTLMSATDAEAFFPKKSTGVLYSFGLPGEDEVGRLGKGKE